MFRTKKREKGEANNQKKHLSEIVGLSSPTLSRNRTHVLHFSTRSAVFETKLSPSAPQASLKKMLFPVQQPGENVRVDWELFFCIFAYFFQYYFYYFLTKGKKGRKKDTLRLPDWPHIRPSAGHETLLFLRVASGQLL